VVTVNSMLVIALGRAANMKVVNLKLCF